MEQRCVGKHFLASASASLRPLSASLPSKFWTFQVLKILQTQFQDFPGGVGTLKSKARSGCLETVVHTSRGPIRGTCMTVEALARCSALVFGGWDAVGIQSLTSLSRPLVASSGRWGWGSSTFTWAQSSSSSSLSVTETKLFTQPATGRPWPHHKAIISLFPGVHMQTWTDVFSASDEMCQSTTAASALLATWSMFSVGRQRKLLIMYRIMNTRSIITHHLHSQQYSTCMITSD